MSIFKRIMSFLLALVMVASMLPATAYAVEAEESVAEETTAPVEETITEPETEEAVPEEISAPTEAIEETEAEPETTEAESISPMEETVPPETVEETEELVFVSDDMALAAGASGSCGENLTWSLDTKGVLTISGNGAMEDYSTEDATPWAEYADQIQKVEIQKGVTTIGDRAFCYGSITKVTLPAGLQRIGCYAFGTSGITEITLPGSVTYVDEVAFSGCSYLTSFTVLDSADSSAEIAFAGNNSLGYGVFSNCPNLETVKLGNTVKVIPDNLFSSCSGLSKITFSDGLRIIGDYAFGGCGSLEEIVLPGSVTNIGKVAFSGCSWLTSFTVLDSTESWAELAFAEINSLGYGVFNNCPNLETVKLGNTVKVIPDRLFSQCEGLRSVTFSDKLSIIGEYAFSSCSKLEEIVLPGSVTNVGKGAFSGCSWLTSFTVLDGKESWLELTFAGINELGYGVFSNCPSLETVKLGNTVKVIPDRLFSQCEGLRSITFSDGLRIIGDYAFGGCGSLEEIVLPGSVTYVGKVAFSGCSWLTSFTVLDSTESWAEITFAEINELGYGVFSHCPNLETVKLGNTVKVIPDRLFSQCEGLRSVTFSDRLLGIGRYAFGGCINLEEIVIPGSVSTIDQVAFSGCSGLTSVTVLDSTDSSAEIIFAEKNELGYGVFSHCPNLETVKLGNTVKVVPDSLFSQCEGLRSVTFSDSLSVIARYAFEGCTNLEEIMIPGSVTEIGSGAFAYSGLKRIRFQGDAPEFGTAENGEGVFAGVIAVAYYHGDNETWTSDVMQSYGGEITWISYADSFEIFAEHNLSYILSGKDLQLTAYNTAADQEVMAEWEISEGSNFATVDTAGLVTAKTVTTPEMIAVTATDLDTGAQKTITLKILPKNTTLDILFEDEIVMGPLDADVRSAEPVSLAARLDGEEIDVSWFSGSEIATVEAGVVSLWQPGTVTITAKDVYGISGSATLNIFYIDPAKKLTASVDVPSIGLQQGQRAQMTVSGKAELAANLLTFTSSNEAMATVDESGMITGGSKTGTVKITAAIQDDPLKRSVTVSVKIIPAQTKTLTLDPDEIILNKADLTTEETRIFVITPTAESEFGSMTLTDKSLKWTSSDTKLAKVKIQKDGSATVTIAANKDGTATITAQSTDLAKVTASMMLRVYDTAPKLGSDKIILNPMTEAGTEVALIPGYDNEVRDVSIDSKDFAVFYDDQTNLLTVKATGEIKNGTAKTIVKVTCTDGETYSLALNITVKNQVPAITVKQTAKMDLFYQDSAVTLNITAKDAKIVGLELTGTDDFVMDETGVIRFADDLADKYGENIKYKPNAKATLLVYLEGYAQPATKAITISTMATGMKLSTDPGSSTVNIHSKFGAAPVVQFKLYDKSAKQILDLDDNDIVSVSGYAVTVESNEVSLTLAEAKKATLMISVQKEGWMYPVTLKHSVSVTEKDPSVKLGKTTLKLNSKLVDLTDSTSAVLTHGNLDLSFGEFRPVKPDANTDLICVEYVNADNGDDIVATIVPGPNGEVPKAGTYSFTAVPMANGEALKPVTVKVSITSAEPKLTLGAKGKLDTAVSASEIVYTVNKIANAETRLADIRIADVEVNGEKLSSDLFELSELNTDAQGKQFFTLKLAEGEQYATKSTYKVTFAYEICGETFETQPLNVKVTQK